VTTFCPTSQDSFRLFPFTTFFGTFFFIQANIHNFGGRTAGKTVGGKFQSWVLDENLSGYLFTKHNPSLRRSPLGSQTTPIGSSPQKSHS
jgi:hypothetical protein